MRIGTQMRKPSALSLQARAIGILKKAASSPAGIFTPGLGYLQKPANLLTWSRDFTNAAWIKEGCTVSGQNIVENTASSTHRIYREISVVAGTTYSLAVRVTANGRNWAAIQLANGFTNTPAAHINLSTGAIGTQIGSPGATVHDYGDGTYLLCINAVAPLTTAVARLYAYAASADATVTYLGDGASGVSVLDAGLFSGTYTASQLAAMGGIPWTRETASVALSLGANLVSGDSASFTSSVGEWTLALGSPVAVSHDAANKRLKLTRTGVAGWGGVEFLLPVTTGKVYQYSAYLDMHGSSGANGKASTVAPATDSSIIATGSAGKATGYFTASANPTRFQLWHTSNALTTEFVTFDDFAVQEVISTQCPVYTDAHAYIAGASGAAVSGLLTNNYKLSTGADGWCAVDDGAGLVLDGMGSLGANLLGASWTVAGGAVASGSTVTLNAGADLYAYQDVMTIGSTYKVEFDYVVTSGATNLYCGTSSGTGENVISLAGLSGSGSFSGFFKAGSNRFIFRDLSGCVAAFTNCTLKEYTGIHATQPTTLSKPSVRLGGDKYYWQFDGSNDYLTLGSVPFTQSDDYLVVTVVNPTAAGRIFAISSTASNNPRIADLSINASGYITGFWKDDASATSTIIGTASLFGSPHVITAWVVGGVRVVRVDGVQIGTNATALGTTTATTATIGALALATVGNNIASGMNGVLPIKGTFNAQEVLTIERLAGQIAGVQF